MGKNDIANAPKLWMAVLTHCFMSLKLIVQICCLQDWKGILINRILHLWRWIAGLQSFLLSLNKIYQKQSKKTGVKEEKQ